MASSSYDRCFAQAKAGLRPSKSTSDKDDQLISFVEDGLNRNGKPARSKPALGLNRKKAEKKKKNSRKKQDLLSRFMIPLQSSAPEVAGLLRLCCDGALFTEVLVYVGFTASISALAPVCRSVVRFWKNSTASPPKLLHLYCFCHLFENINVRPWQRVPPNGGSWPLHLRTSSDFYRWRSFLLIQRHQ